MENKSINEIPELPLLEKELKRVNYKKRYLTTLKNTVFTLITVAAISVLVATLWMPVLRIYGTSMTPTLEDGSIVVSYKTDKYKTGDVIAFYYNNKILVKRVIAQSGDWVDIDKKGIVKVNGEVIDEPYIEEFSFGECDICLPYQVPEERVFVMGDHRDVSIDSRNTSVGCVAEEQVVGIITYKVWPLNKISRVK